MIVPVDLSQKILQLTSLEVIAVSSTDVLLSFVHRYMETT